MRRLKLAIPALVFALIIVVSVVLLAVLAPFGEWRGRCAWDDGTVATALSALDEPFDEPTANLALKALRRHRGWTTIALWSAATFLERTCTSRRRCLGEGFRLSDEEILGIA